MAAGDFASSLITSYQDFLSILPPYLQSFLNLFILVLLISGYSIIIWKFYKFISKKNIFGLNLSKYNTAKHAFSIKLFASLLYLLEYIILIPFMIFIWFSLFTFLLFILAEEGIAVSTILFISAVVIAAIRMTSYYKKAISEDIAKILPLTFLAVFVLNPNLLNIDFMSRVISRFSEIPSFFSQIITYLGFIFLLEIVLRFFDFVFTILDLQSGDDEDEEKD